MFVIIVNVLGHPKGVRGLTSNFLHGGGMDVFWNDPIIEKNMKKIFKKKIISDLPTVIFSQVFFLRPITNVIK